MNSSLSSTLNAASQVVASAKICNPLSLASYSLYKLFANASTAAINVSLLASDTTVASASRGIALSLSPPWKLAT